MARGLFHPGPGAKRGVLTGLTNGGGTFSHPSRSLRYYGLVREAQLNAGFQRVRNWLSDPLNPHAIAELRTNTYTRFTLLSLIRCILDYADAEFTRDTGESNARARTLYQTFGQPAAK